VSCDAVARVLAARNLRLGFVVILLALALLVCAGVAGSRFVWNLSPSMPRGLYLSRRDLVPTLGSTVLFAPPPVATAVIRVRHYLPPGVSLLKRIVAIPGERVCIGPRLFLANGVVIGEVALRDSAGRPLAPFVFCDVVPRGAAFVATTAQLSFDSRYFGPVTTSNLTLVVPIWTF
jgi:conjugative transfer signal peptidase TraF